MLTSFRYLKLKKSKFSMLNFMQKIADRQTDRQIHQKNSPSEFSKKLTYD